MGVLRLLLALSVLATHCGAILNLNFVPGRVAVQSFYIISGFYMSLIINEKYINKNGSYKLFISNRFLRIYPIYWAVLIMTILVFVAFYFVSKSHHLPKFEYYTSVAPNIWSFGYLILSNLAIFGQDLVMFLGINPSDGSLFFTSDFTKTNPPLHYFLFIPQAWTIGIELAFYLISPFILKRNFKTVLALIVITILLRLFLYNGLNLKHDPWTYRFFPTELLFFLMGYVSYKIYLKIKEKMEYRKYAIPLFSAITLLTLFYEYIPPFKYSMIPFSIKEIVYLLLIMFSIPIIFNFSKNIKWDIKIGELSYPVYISHVLVYFVVTVLPLPVIHSGFSVAILTILFSVLLNKFVANPIEKLRQARIK